MTFCMINKLVASAYDSYNHLPWSVDFRQLLKLLNQEKSILSDFTPAGSESKANAAYKVTRKMCIFFV